MLVHFSECAGTIGSDWWSDIKWYADNIFIGAITHSASSGLMWNIAGNSAGGPKLPGTTSCGGNGCRPIAYIYSGGSYSLNQECRFTSFLTFKNRRVYLMRSLQSTLQLKLPKPSFPKTSVDHGDGELECR